jgi:4-alpha-glucanotransferase
MDNSLLESPRASGILLHPTSLPGPGIGDLGRAAERWVDWLAGAGQSLWQVLPLVPVNRGGSPYNGLSALAGNPLLLSPERLVEDGLLEEGDTAGGKLPEGRVDFEEVCDWKEEVLRQAHTAFRRGAAPELRGEFEAFCERSATWVEDHALYQALRAHHCGTSWAEWEPGLRDRDPQALERWRRELEEDVERHTFAQFLFDRQWRALRDYANRRGIRIIGDLPIFVDHDSADVWANRDLFWLDEEGRCTVVSGVPPDYFSETGQLWGNPLYRWEVMAERDYRWWTERFRRIFEQVDIARIDHFRGFEAYWEVPASAETAIEGSWRPGPGTALFAAVERELGALPLIAEDLGLITPEVEELRDELGFPGMRVLQFAFDGDPRNLHLPEHHVRNAVSYTGTHDNDTAVGWWRSLEEAERRQVSARLNGRKGEIHWELIRLALESRAQFAVVPLQDVLGLGSEARMNTPGVGAGNWEWRFREGTLTTEVQDRLLEVTRASRRERPVLSPADHPQPAGGFP